MLSIILLVFAFVLFVLAGAYNAQAEPWRGRLVCFDLACFSLAFLVDRIPSLK